MRICYLTQTATKPSDYYIEFFKGKDLFFVTFKTPHPDAVGFLPKSTWSDGRNKLWEELKDKYDYYVFIDDDLVFYTAKPRFPSIPFLSFLYYKWNKGEIHKCFEKSDPAYYFKRLEHYLEKFKPEVLSVTKVDGDPNSIIDTRFLRGNSYVRRLGYFDAQFTVFSNYAASKLLPYDNEISGWWSSQIPIYLYAFHVFGKKAIQVIDLGTVNSNFSNGTYVENYDGMGDCITMVDAISKATGKNFNATAGPIGERPVNNNYGNAEILKTKITTNDKEDYKANYEKSLKGLETMLHTNLLP